jgi:hypothetical protein
MTHDVLRRAKEAWRASMDRDDAFAAPHRERRLEARREESPRLRRAAVVSPIVGVALALLAGGAMATVAGAHWIGRSPFGLTLPKTGSTSLPAPKHRVLLERAPASTSFPRLRVSGAADSDRQVESREEVRPVAPEVRRAPIGSLAAATQEDPEAVWKAAEDALAKGNRTAAERLLGSLVAMRTANGLHDRASLSLAELELARGEVIAGRERLASLAASTDPALAADAVFLDARASSVAERVEVYERYLATQPPSPFREEAMVERARALILHGDAAGARACVDELHKGPQLPSIVRASVEDLDRRLARQPGD